MQMMAQEGFCLKSPWRYLLIQIPGIDFRTPETFVQDRDADGMISKIFSSVGHENAANDKDALEKIFKTIDTDGTGSCSIEELTVGSTFL